MRSAEAPVRIAEAASCSFVGLLHCLIVTATRITPTKRVR